MSRFNELLTRISDVLWHDAVLLVVLGVGVLLTLWSRVGQRRALVHGVAVLRGKYDDGRDPGAITHFQALSAALSATVGLGNIAGVAIAISVGGPGAVFWMWITGFIGMALKMTEVTQAMLHRNLDDPQNPHGGAMWVCRKGFARWHPRLAPVGTVLGVTFCLTLLVSAITGGNMFQAWNVADISSAYFGVPRLYSGILMTVVVGLVVLGGIRRIGAVTGRLVPLMCAGYLVAGLAVIVAEIDRVPAMFGLIFRSAFAPAEATGAFIGGSVGWAFLKGMQRALFSNEAGQGSAPIAHSAARTREPVREGIVAGLEPFVDTICVCSITAIVILLSGVWNREAAFEMTTRQDVVEAIEGDASTAAESSSSVVTEEKSWTLPRTVVEPSAAGRDPSAFSEGHSVSAVLDVSSSREGTRRSGLRRLTGTLEQEGANWYVAWSTVSALDRPTLVGTGVFLDFKGATLTARAFDRVLPGLGSWIVPATAWLFAISTIISWSYYGEQAVVFLFGARAIRLYQVIYCLLILVATSPLVSTEEELDVLSTFGTGVMLWANIPILLLFSGEAMRAYHAYIRRLDAGDFAPDDTHAPPSSRAGDAGGPLA